MSQPRREVDDGNAGVFVMRCWVRGDGEVAGRVRWFTVDGDNESSTLGTVEGLVHEVQSFLKRVTRGHEDEDDRGP